MCKGLQKLLSLLLCTMLVLGAVPTSAFAAPEEFIVTLSANPSEGGTVTGGGTFSKNNQPTITATPNSGYTFVGWTENGTFVTEETSFQLPKLTANRNLVANFSSGSEAASYPVVVTCSADQGNAKDCSASASPALAKEGDTVTLSANPAAGYYLVRWEVVSGDVTVNNNQFTMGSSDVKINAVFSRATGNTYAVTVTNDGNGSASAAPAGGAEGTEVTLSAAPNDGYRFKEWQVISGGITVTDNKFTIGTANVEVKAIFEEIPTATTYAVTVSASPEEGGNVTGAGDYEAGATVTLSATATDGYTFTKWEVNPSSVEMTNNTFTMPAQAVTVTAIFKEETTTPEPTTYTVSFDPNGGSGTMDSVTGISGEYTLPTCSFTAPSGKQFQAWQVGENQYQPGNKITVSTNTEVEAIWEDVPVTLYTVSINSDGKGQNNVTATPQQAAANTTVTLNVSYQNDSKVQISVTYGNPEQECTLTWENETVCHFTMPASDVTVQATFTKKNDVVNVTDITLSDSQISLEAEASHTLAATVAPDDATNKAISWTSSDSAVATVDNGVITAVSAGYAVITATTVDGSKTASCAVIVKPSATSISYGQSLSASTLSDGWEWADGTIVPSSYSDHTVRLKADSTITCEVPVIVIRTTPVITLSGVPETANIGDTVTVGATIKNPHNESLNDLPAVSLTYQIGSGEATPFTGSFTIPLDTPYGTVITVSTTTAYSDLYAIVSKTGTITVKATAVSHTGTDKEITYDGNFYDVAQLFNIDTNAGAATYAVTGGTGTGTLNGSSLDISKSGTFTIKLTTAAKAPYAAGEATAELTVNKGVNTVSVTMESWTYGETAKGPATTGIGTATFQYKVKDAADETYSSEKPSNAGNYTVKADFAETALYKAATAMADFTISKATYDLSGLAWDYNGAFDYNAESKTVTLTGTHHSNLSVTYSGNTATEAGNYTATATFVNQDEDNYNTPVPMTLNWSIVNTWDPTEFTTTALDSNGWTNGDFVITPAADYLIENEAGEWVAKLTFTADTNNGSVTFRLKNADGSKISQSKTVTYKIDKIPAAGTITIGELTGWQEFLNTISFDLFFKDQQTVTVKAQDALSGVASIQYYASSSAMTLDQVAAINFWTDYPNNGVAVSKEDAKKFVYFAKITDVAGNVTYLSTDGATYDTSAPVIDIDAGTYYTTQIVTASDTNLLSLTLNDVSVTPPVALEGNKDITYTLIAIDKAGNVTKVVVTMKPIAALDTTLTSSTVALSDKAAIEATKANAAAIRDEANPYMTDAEKQALTAIVVDCDALLTQIANATAVNDLINALPKKSDVIIDSKEHNEAYTKAAAAYGKLTDNEKRLVGLENKVKLDAVLEELTDYQIIKKSAKAYVKDSYKDFTITVNGYAEKFNYVTIDNKTVDPKYYTVKSGSTIITLKARYLEYLSNGDHIIKVYYTDSTSPATGTLRITDNNGSPFTGDNNQILFFAALSMSSLLCMTAMILFAPRKKGKYQE